VSDLDFLKNVTPVLTDFKPSNRGRQPGENVMESHVIKSYDSPKALAVEVPAAKAHTVERAIRRAGTAHGWKVSVQALKVHPESATGKHVIPLRELPDLTGPDIWLSFKAIDKDDDDKTADSPAAAPSTDKADAPAAPSDPFKGQPADVGNGAAKTPAVRKSVAATK
jgi:hypothetical protein